MESIAVQIKVLSLKVGQNSELKRPSSINDSHRYKKFIDLLDEFLTLVETRKSTTIILVKLHAQMQCMSRSIRLKDYEEPKGITGNLKFPRYKVIVSK